MNYPTAALAASPITAGYIMSQLCKWEQSIYTTEAASGSSSDAESFQEKFEEIPQDWMCGGLWLLAEAIAIAADNAPMEWDDGVFVYTHCNDDDGSIWVPIVNKMTADDWGNLCGNNIVPQWVGSEVLSVMRGLNLLTEA